MSSSPFPGLILLIWLSTVLGQDVKNIIIALAFFSLPTYARLTRGNTLSIREMEYVLAARSLGAGGLRIVFLHVLPAIVPPIIVLDDAGGFWRNHRWREFELSGVGRFAVHAGMGKRCWLMGARSSATNGG